MSRYGKQKVLLLLSANRPSSGCSKSQCRPCFCPCPAWYKCQVKYNFGQYPFRKGAMHKHHCHDWSDVNIFLRSCPQTFCRMSSYKLTLHMFLNFKMHHFDRPMKAAFSVFATPQFFLQWLFFGSHYANGCSFSLLMDVVVQVTHKKTGSGRHAV